MNFCEKFFNFNVLAGGCGITKVYLLGKIDDWCLLRKKVDFLKEYAIEQEFFLDWIHELGIIVDNFIYTYEGKECCKDFWLKVIDSNKKPESLQSS